MSSPPDLGWQSDPFKMTIKNGRVYGRGSSDNKGPALACYYAALALKKAGFVPRKKITFIIGTDEETDWVGMKYYLQKRPAPNLALLARFLLSVSQRASRPGCPQNHLYQSAKSGCSPETGQF
jgi:acetylornithine deacetylase/succinyl-diaminopimelate desuccinylase-like protein